MKKLDYGQRLFFGFVVMVTIGMLYQVYSFYAEGWQTKVTVINSPVARAEEPVELKIVPANPTNDDIINEASKKYNVDPGLVKAILKCESSLRHDDVFGDNGMSYGWAQFQLKTFRWLKKLAKMEHLDYEDKNDQVELLAWALSAGRGSEWSCYKKIK
jgi:hypothetical protein